MQTEYSIAELCAALRVTRSGYHAWVDRAPGPRAQADVALLPLITQAHRESRQTYGRLRITHWLQMHGQRCGRMRMARLMRQLGLVHQRRQRFPPQSLTDSNHDLPVAPDLLTRREPTAQPDAVWVADITYVSTAEGWLYVAGLLDHCTQRCIAGRLATPLPWRR